MIKPYIPNLFKFELENIFKENNVKNLDDFLRFLYNEDSDLVIKFRFPNRTKKTMLNRFNTIWFYPLFILSIPFTYLLLGDFHISEDSNIGKIIIKLIGKFD